MGPRIDAWHVSEQEICTNIFIDREFSARILPEETGSREYLPMFRLIRKFLRIHCLKRLVVGTMHQCFD